MSEVNPYQSPQLPPQPIEDPRRPATWQEQWLAKGCWVLPLAATGLWIASSGFIPRPGVALPPRAAFVQFYIFAPGLFLLIVGTCLSCAYWSRRRRVHGLAKDALSGLVWSGLLWLSLAWLVFCAVSFQV